MQRNLLTTKILDILNNTVHAKYGNDFLLKTNKITNIVNSYIAGVRKYIITTQNDYDFAKAGHLIINGIETVVGIDYIEITPKNNVKVKFSEDFYVLQNSLARIRLSGFTEAKLNQTYKVHRSSPDNSLEILLIPEEFILNKSMITSGVDLKMYANIALQMVDNNLCPNRLIRESDIEQIDSKNFSYIVDSKLSHQPFFEQAYLGEASIGIDIDIQSYRQNNIINISQQSILPQTNTKDDSGTLSRQDSIENHIIDFVILYYIRDQGISSNNDVFDKTAGMIDYIEDILYSFDVIETNNGFSDKIRSGIVAKTKVDNRMYLNEQLSPNTPSITHIGFGMSYKFFFKRHRNNLLESDTGFAYDSIYAQQNFPDENNLSSTQEIITNIV